MKVSLWFPSLMLALLFVFCGVAGAADLDALKEELRVCPHRILFERYADNNWDLFVMHADGSDVRNLTKTPAVHEMYPKASPDGKRICFQVDTEKDGKTLRSIYYMNADGTERKLVCEKARQPCWSPDGKKIAFLKQEFNRFEIKDFGSKGLFFYDLATGKTKKHPNEKIEHLYAPNWSPDSKWIVSTVHAGMGYGHGILAIDVNGEGVYDLGLHGCRPCLSDDGSQVTWSSNDHTIGLADIDFSQSIPKATDIRAIAKHKELHLYHPDFSPDGRYVTFSSGPGGRVAAKGPGTHTEVAEMVGVCGPWDIFLVRSDGQGDPIQLTHDASLSSKESDWLPAAQDATQ